MKITEIMLVDNEKVRVGGKRTIGPILMEREPGLNAVLDLERGGVVLHFDGETKGTFVPMLRVRQIDFELEAYSPSDGKTEAKGDKKR